jgi:hypothetical protein
VNLIDILLPVVRKVADNLAGSPLADAALADVREIEAVAARHVTALESELTAWLTARLHPESVPAAPADPAQPAA